jgi:hypothetical protein
MPFEAEKNLLFFRAFLSQRTFYIYRCLRTLLWNFLDIPLYSFLNGRQSIIFPGGFLREQHFLSLPFFYDTSLWRMWVRQRDGLWLYIYMCVSILHNCAEQIEYHATASITNVSWHLIN